MIPKMNEIEEAKVEYLKKFPELVLEIKRHRMACCHRCGGFINLDHYCLMAMTHNYNNPVNLDRFGCPHCKLVNCTTVRKGFVSRDPVAHSLIEVIEYRVDRKKVKRGMFREEIAETWVKQWYPV